MKCATRILVCVIAVSKSREFLLKVRPLFIYFSTMTQGIRLRQVDVFRRCRTLLWGHRIIIVELVRGLGVYVKSHSSMYPVFASTGIEMTSKFSISYLSKNRNWPIGSGSDILRPYKLFSSRYWIHEWGFDGSYSSTRRLHGDSMTVRDRCDDTTHAILHHVIHIWATY